MAMLPLLALSVPPPPTKYTAKLPNLSYVGRSSQLCPPISKSPSHHAFTSTRFFVSNSHQQATAARLSTSVFPPLSQSVAAIIFGDGTASELYPLTKTRSDGAIPIAANYRLVDVVVSNCINSNITKIYAFTQINSTSLNSHLSRAYSALGLGREGFVEVIAAYQSHEDNQWFQGTADAVRRCLWVLDEHPVSEFLLLPGHHLYQMDYQKLVNVHRNSGADITVAAASRTAINGTNPRYGYLQLNSDNKVLQQLREMPDGDPQNPSIEDGTRGYWSMGLCVIKRDALAKLLRRQCPDAIDFANEVIPAAINGGMKVQSYVFDGYWEDMRNIEAFYKANMDIRGLTAPGFNFYDKDSPVYTLPRCMPPTLMSEAVVTQSIIGDGCILHNCKIKNSVIGMRSCIRERVLIENSVVMGADIYPMEDIQRSETMGRGTEIPIGIGEGSFIKKAIIDKNARIGQYVRITNKDNVQEANRENRGYVISGGIVTVLRGAVISNGTII